MCKSSKYQHTCQIDFMCTKNMTLTFFLCPQILTSFPSTVRRKLCNGRFVERRSWAGNRRDGRIKMLHVTAIWGGGGMTRYIWNITIKFCSLVLDGQISQCTLCFPIWSFEFSRGAIFHEVIKHGSARSARSSSFNFKFR